jgi:uncharacterized Zn finger protein (UPF0148 family)
MAVRVGEKKPDFYEKMDKAVCPSCGATFWIIHHKPFENKALVTNQIKSIEHILSGEHVDPKYLDHLKSYDIGDSDSK